MNAATTMNMSKQALDFAPAILAIQARPASPLPRVMLYTLFTLFVLIVLWAIFGKVDVVAVAQGKLVPQSYLKIVQQAEAGIVKEILVKEGDTVKQGQILMRMDAKLLESDTKMAEAELKQRALQLRRIDAELAGTPLIQKPGDDSTQFQQILSQHQSHRQAIDDAVAQDRRYCIKPTTTTKQRSRPRPSCNRCSRPIENKRQRGRSCTRTAMRADSWCWSGNGSGSRRKGILKPRRLPLKV